MQIDEGMLCDRHGPLLCLIVCFIRILLLTFRREFYHDSVLQLRRTRFREVM